MHVIQDDPYQTEKADAGTSTLTSAALMRDSQGVAAVSTAR